MATRIQHILGPAMGLALAAISFSACQGNRSELPPVHLIQNMDFQQRYDPQERNDFFADHRAQRPEVDGTVAYGRSIGTPDPDMLRADDAYYRGRGANGRLVDDLPKQVQEQFGADLLKRGEERYNIYCSVCHGETGRGDGMAVRRAGAFKVPPPSYHQDKYRAMPIGHFYKVINEGQGTMLSYAAQVPVEDRWAIAAWVRVLQTHGKNNQWDDSPEALAAAKVAKPAADKAAPAGDEPKDGGTK